MRRYMILSFALALGAPALMRAQDADGYTAEDSDYDDYFGASGEEEESSQPKEEGPHSLAEAKRQGKTFTIGGGGRHRRLERDVHVVQKGDTLWSISDRYFGDPWHWPELWSYNPEITNPHWIYPLDQVRLSGETLAQDELQAAAVATQEQAAKAAGSTGFVEPAHGLLSELAPRVTVNPKLMKPDTVFLRDQGYLDDDAIKSAGQIVAGNEEQMFLSDSDEAYVKFKPGQDIRAGQQYTVYRDIKEQERDPGEKGKLVRIMGTVVVRSYDREKGLARTTVTESMEPIERGLYVARMERRFDLVPPTRNEKNVVAHIVASVQPRSLLSFGNVVFLDVGEGHGIVPGNRFFVVRRGDNWMDVLQRDAQEMGNVAPVPAYNKEDLPKEVVAELRVIKVRKTTTVALVTRSDTDIFQGDTAEMRQGF